MKPIEEGQNRQLLFTLPNASLFHVAPPNKIAVATNLPLEIYEYPNEKTHVLAIGMVRYTLSKEVPFVRELDKRIAYTFPNGDTLFSLELPQNVDQKDVKTLEEFLKSKANLQIKRRPNVFFRAVYATGRAFGKGGATVFRGLGKAGFQVGRFFKWTFMNAGRFLYGTVKNALYYTFKSAKWTATQAIRFLANLLGKIGNLVISIFRPGKRGPEEEAKQKAEEEKALFLKAQKGIKVKEDEGEFKIAQPKKKGRKSSAKMEKAVVEGHGKAEPGQKEILEGHE